MEYERNFKLINRKFIELLFPTIAVSIAGNFAVLIDAFLISHILGSSYLSVVQSVQPIVLSASVLYWMIGIGGGILCSIAKADFNDDKGNMIFTVSLVSVVLIGLILAISIILFPDFFSQLICSSTELRPFVNQYLIFFGIGIPFLCHLACIAYFIKSYGFIKLQFWAYLMANVLNVAFDVVFMKYLNMGIAGAGLATSVGFIISAIFISSYFFNSKKPVKLVRVKLGIFFRYFGHVCKSGFSSSSINLYESLRIFFINYLITMIIGAVGLEAYNVYNNILFIVMIFILGTVQSIVPIVTVYCKEEDYKGVAYVCDRSMKIVIGFGVFFTLLFIIFPEISLFLFDVTNTDSIPVMLNAIRLTSLCFVGFAVSNLYVFYAQSAQHTKLSNFISLFEGLIFPVLLSYILSHFWGINGIWISFAISEALTILSIFIYSRYISKKTNNKYSGFFLIGHNDDETIFEYTINGNINDAHNLSKKVKESIHDFKKSNDIGLAIDEMLVNIIEINDDVDLIDVSVRDKKESIVISIKYSGIVFNPLEYEHSNDFALLKELVDDVEYSQILEINNIRITLKV